jgi:flagellar operon protein
MVERVQFVPEAGATTPRQAGAATRRTTESGPRFDEVLRDRLAGPSQVQFSAHASRRLDSRGINITPGERQLIEEGVRRAAEKGARESLLVTDRFALVVSVRNRKVITVTHNDELDGGVFTNIDSAVVCRGGTAAPQLVGGTQMDQVQESRLDLA